MAQLINKNAQTVAPFFKNGVSLQWFVLSFPSTVAAKLTTDNAGYLAGTYTAEQAKSPVSTAFHIIQQACSIEMIGTISDLSTRESSGGGVGRDVRFAVAAAGGDFGTSRWDGTNSESFAAYLQRLVQAAGTKQGVNLASCTVAAMVL
jgi:hypothetical protein